jgi:RHS repeat-associated protein
VIGQYTNSWATASAVLMHGPNMDDPIMRTAGTTTQYFHQDGLGSVVSVTDQSGVTNGTARFDAWGNKIASTGTIPQYGYTGREPDDTGLVYYRARFYDPSIGRFTQRDPIGMSDGVNLYAYVKGNPINFNDPTGLKVSDPDEPVRLAAAAGYTEGIGGGLTSAQQTLARFTDPLTDYRGRVIEPDDLNMAVATVYAEVTGSGFTRSPYNTFTRPEIVGGTKSVVTTTVTEDGQAIEANAIADVLFNRLDNPNKFAGKIDGRIPSTLGEVVFANGHFTSVNSNVNPRFAEALFGSKVSDPQAYELARAA